MKAKSMHPIIIGILTSSWMLSFFWALIDLQIIGFVLQVGFLIFALIGILKDRRLARFLLVRAGPSVAIINVILLTNLLKDSFSADSQILIFKTFFYINSSIAIGAFIANSCAKSPKWLRLWGLSFAITQIVAGLVLILIFFQSGYSIGGSLLKTDVAESYQGISRIFGQIALVSAIILPIFVSILLTGIAVFVAISYSSFGVFVAILLSAIVVLIRHLRETNGSWHFVWRFLILSVLVSFSLYLISSKIDAGVNLSFLNRLQGKLDNSGGVESRFEIYLFAIHEIFDNFKNFIWGPNIFEFSCSIRQCQYFHAHNIFLNFWFFFGIFSIPLSGITCWLFLKSVKNLKSSDTVFLFSVLFLLYFGLSLFGGDLEQNRNLFLASSGLLFAIESRKIRLNRGKIRSIPGLVSIYHR